MASQTPFATNGARRSFKRCMERMDTAHGKLIRFLSPLHRQTTWSELTIPSFSFLFPPPLQCERESFSHAFEAESYVACHAAESNFASVLWRSMCLQFSLRFLSILQGNESYATPLNKTYQLNRCKHMYQLSVNVSMASRS